MDSAFCYISDKYKKEAGFLHPASGKFIWLQEIFLNLLSGQRSVSHRRDYLP